MCPAKTQVSLDIHPVWSEFSLSAWRNIGSLATNRAESKDLSDWVNAHADQSLRVKDPRFLHTDSEDSDQARQMGWSESSLGAQVILLVLSCSDSYKTQSSYRIIEKWWHAKKTSFPLLLETV